MFEATELRTVNIRRAHALRLKPKIVVLTGDDVFFETECGNVKTVDDIDRFEIEANGFVEWNKKHFSFFTVWIFKPPFPHHAGHFDGERVRRYIAHREKRPVAVPKHHHYERGRNKCPGDFEQCAFVGFLSLRMPGAMIFDGKENH